MDAALKLAPETAMPNNDTLKTLLAVLADLCEQERPVAVTVRHKGFVGRVVVRPAGEERPRPPPPPRPDPVATLSTIERKLLAVATPDPQTAKWFAARAGYKPGAAHVRRALGQLVRMGLLVRGIESGTFQLPPA